MPSLTPHLYVPTVTRPLRAKEHFLRADTQVEMHSHPWPQLTYSTRGTLRLSTPQDSYFIPPSRVLLVPANLAHSINVQEDAELRTVYLLPTLDPGDARCKVLEMGPLLLALLLALDPAPDGAPAKDAQAAERERWITPLLMNELERAPSIRLDIPLPQDKRLRSLCEKALADLADGSSLADRASRVGASPRTLARLFREEMGMSWLQWRQQAVVARAVPMLARGVSVSQVAADSGYATDSAFCAMFRARTGYAPGHYLKRRTAASSRSRKP